jgi:periplasmic protein TonB
MRDLEILAQCLVEGDAARLKRSRRLRRRALFLSIGVEAMFLAALLLAPLAAPSTLLQRFDWTPAPPYRGVTRLEPRRAAAHDPTPVHHAIHITPLFSPTRIPPIARDTTVPDDAEIGPSSKTGNDRVSDGGQVGLPGGFDPGPRTQPPLPPQDSPRPPIIVHKSEGAQAALLEHRVMPSYPPLAIQTRTEGEVRLHAIISTDGTIKSLEVESGNPLFILAARSAVEQWRYKAAVLNGQSVEVDTFITVIFHLAR